MSTYYDKSASKKHYFQVQDYKIPQAIGKMSEGI